MKVSCTSRFNELNFTPIIPFQLNGVGFQKGEERLQKNYENFISFHHFMLDIYCLGSSEDYDLIRAQPFDNFKF